MSFQDTLCHEIDLFHFKQENCVLEMPRLAEYAVLVIIMTIITIAATTTKHSNIIFVLTSYKVSLLARRIIIFSVFLYAYASQGSTL